jgi:hypothetical protein
MAVAESSHDVLEQAGRRGVAGAELGEGVALSNAIAPASWNESQTAAPATWPAAPSSEKMPAPTMAPTPMNAA